MQRESRSVNMVRCVQTFTHRPTTSVNPKIFTTLIDASDSTIARGAPRRIASCNASSQIDSHSFEVQAARRKRARVYAKGQSDNKPRTAARNARSEMRLAPLLVAQRAPVRARLGRFLDQRLTQLLEARLAQFLDALRLAPQGAPLRAARAAGLPSAQALRLPALAPLLPRGRVDDIDEEARQVDDEAQGEQPERRGQRRRGRASEARRRELEEVAERRRAELGDQRVARHEVGPLCPEQDVARRHQAVGVHVGKEAPLPVLPPCHLHWVRFSRVIADSVPIRAPLRNSPPVPWRTMAVSHSRHPGLESSEGGRLVARWTGRGT